MERLDKFLVRTRRVRSRAHALDLIRTGQILLNGSPAQKASQGVAAGANVEVVSTPEEPGFYVSRAALKLKRAMADFGLHGPWRRALDVGASTGGFTQVLLEEGAEEVLAVDVGRQQLHARLRADRRVVVREQTHVADLQWQDVDPFPNIVVIDVSFISVCKVLAEIVRLSRAQLIRTQPATVTSTDIVVLIKPQFEVGPERISRGGLARTEHHPWAIQKVRSFAKALRLQEQRCVPAAIAGADGNQEYVMWLKQLRGLC